MITSIVFSKDRALQLDLTLKTIRKNFELCDDLIVIYKTSEQQYEESYENLKLEHPNVLFLKQSHSLFVDVLATISGAESDYICFFTDDDIFYRKVSFTYDNINWLFDQANISCLSLRMGHNTTQRQINGKIGADAMPSEGLLVTSEDGGDPQFSVWNRMTIAPGGYWAYALSVDGHIFKRETMLKFCTELEVLNRYNSYKGVPREKNCWNQTPNEFESKLQMFYFEIPAYMASPIHSCVVNSPNNRVQEHIENRAGDIFSYSASSLNDHYMRGKRLNINKINFESIVCPHQEIDIMKGLE